jgi:Zn-dependent protease
LNYNFLFGPAPDLALFVDKICWIGIEVNAGLAIFNLLPIYPLDGHHILSYLAPRSWRPVIDNPAWGMVFLALVLIKPLHDMILVPIMTPFYAGVDLLVQTLFGMQ